MEISESEKEEQERIKKLVKKHALELIEHFGSVQIFVTKESTRTRATLYFDEGFGNYFARYGQVNQWLQQEDEATRLEANKDE